MTKEQLKEKTKLCSICGGKMKISKNGILFCSNIFWGDDTNAISKEVKEVKLQISQDLFDQEYSVKFIIL